MYVSTFQELQEALWDSASSLASASCHESGTSHTDIYALAWVQEKDTWSRAT